MEPDARTIRRNLHDLLPKRSEYASMKPDEALGVLSGTARPLVENVMDVPGIDACRSSLAEGTWDPKVLFGGMVVNEDLADHPGMAWRLQQAR